MSNLRIALVAEGPTDFLVIEAALKAILPRPFVLQLLQPEATRPDLGNGWGGVLKWCRDGCQRGYGALENDPTLALFDLLIIHLDADVADKSYADCGDEIEQAATQHGWEPLPCAVPCPPSQDTVEQLKSVLLSWLGVAEAGDKTVLCIPSKAVESWLAAAVLPDTSALLAGLECTMNLEARLAALPKAQRIKKTRREYLQHAGAVSARWERVCAQCSQAEVFHRHIAAAV